MALLQSVSFIWLLNCDAYSDISSACHTITRLATVASHVACSIQDAAIWLVEVPLAVNSRKGELRSVPADGVRGSISYKEMLRVHYLPVQKKSFHTIHLYITNDVGELVPFQSGRSVVTLHFRRSGITSRWGLYLTTDLRVIIMIITCNRHEMVVYRYTPDIAYNEGLVWQIYSLGCGDLLFRYLKTQLKQLPRRAWKQGYGWLGMYCVDEIWKINWNAGGWGIEFSSVRRAS